MRGLARLSFSLVALVPTSALAQFFVAPVPLGPPAENSDWSNYVVIADLDGDGDLDAIVPNCGTFGGTTPQPLRFYQNDGTGAFTSSTPITKAVRQVAIGDIDGDGDLDVFVPDAGSATPDLLYLNDGTGGFTDVAATQLPPGLSSEAGGARFADVDGDGDLDLLVANGYPGMTSPDRLSVYLNDGAGSFEEHAASPLAIGTGDSYDIDVFDADGDFDLDVLVDKHNGGSKHRLLLNDGTGGFTDVSMVFPGPAPTSFLHYNPSACDIDGDGDRDLLLDNSGPNGGEQVFQNDGAANFTDVTASALPMNAGIDDNGFVCVDIDNDGDFDGAVAALKGGNERIQINNGSGTFQLNNTSFPPVVDSTLWIDFGDLNGDGRLDAITAQGEGSLPYTNLVYIGNNNNPVDTLAPKIFQVESIGTPAADTPTRIRYAVSDRVATDVGPRLQAAYLKFTAPAAQAQVPAHFVGGDLFYATVPGFAAGTQVSFQPCATDQQGNEGCGAAVSFTIAGGMGTGGSGGNGSGGNGTGGAAGGAGGDGGAAGGAGGSGGNGGSGNAPQLSSGCGCSVPGQGSPLGALALALPALALLGRSRRKSR